MQTKTEQLFDETKITLNDALDRNAQLFKLDDLNKSTGHYYKAVDILNAKGKISSITEELERSISYLTIMNEEIDNSNDFFKNVLTARKNAIN